MTLALAYKDFRLKPIAKGANDQPWFPFLSQLLCLKVAGVEIIPTDIAEVHIGLVMSHLNKLDSDLEKRYKERVEQTGSLPYNL